MDVHLNNYIISLVAINGLSSVAAGVLNFLIILTFVKTPSLRTPSNVLILSLAITDFGVGLIVQPTFIVHLFAFLVNNQSLFEITGLILHGCFWTLVSASFLTMSAITVDRFLALQLHLRYQELVTTRRTCIAEMVIMTISPFAIFIHFHVVVNAMIVIIGCSVFLLNIVLMVRISQVVNKHSNQIHAQGETSQGNINMPRYKKSVNTMYYIMGTFVVCYTPMIIVDITNKIIGEKISQSRQCTVTSLALINSAFNPVIYFWRMQEMRNAVIKFLRSIGCGRGGN